jgi:hypothetical protein
MTTNVAYGTGAPTLAAQIATSVATQNKIAGRAIAASEVTVTFPPTPVASVPKISVEIRRNDVATFFARGWGTNSVQVSGKAIAEAYNPSNWTGGSDAAPLAPQCVKPWLLPNQDPAGGKFFAAGAVTGTTAVGGTITLTYGCASGGCTGGLPTGTLTKNTPAPQPQPTSPKAVDFFPAEMTRARANSWPGAPNSCQNLDCEYEENIASCSADSIVAAPAGTPNATVQLQREPGCSRARATQTYDGTRCLIHQVGTAANNEQDSLDGTTNPLSFIAGSKNPLVGNGLALSDTITSSDSLVTIPVYDEADTFPRAGRFQPVRVIGYIQGFVNQVQTDGTRTNISVTIVNLVSWGTVSANSPVVGDGTSAVPVHLVAQ